MPIEEINNYKARLIFTVDEVAAALQPGGPRLRLLLLADDAHPANVVLDHIQSIKHHSRHNVTVVNPIQYYRGWLISALCFDVILIHYSVLIISDRYFPKKVASFVKEFPGPKIQIIQDEYRWIDRVTRQMAALGINAVFSSLVPENIARVYHHDYLAHVRFFSGLPGYVSERLHRIRILPLAARPFHLVYRGRPLPIWLGKFSQEKARIGLQGAQMAAKYGLAVDCETKEEERVYGVAWIELLMRGRSVLATEGGATVFDFDSTVERGVGEYRRNNPDASDEEVWNAVVQPHEGNVVHKTITPRVFEAIMCHTALVMYPGRYREILNPWEHYIPLERDGSNTAEVAGLLKDTKYLEELVERAYWRVVNDPRLQFANYVAALDHAAVECAQTSLVKSVTDVRHIGDIAGWVVFIGGVERGIYTFERFLRKCARSLKNKLT